MNGHEKGDKMKRQMLKAMTVLFAAGFANAAFAETWIGRCNKLQFNFNRTSKTFLVYFDTSAGIFQMAKGKISFDNGSAVRGAIDGNGFGSDGQPITQIGLNPSRNLIYVLYNHPTTNEIKSGDFCSTTIQSVP
jgi:hypothetical protein